MAWKVGEAKQQLSQVVRACAGSPQRIYNRNRLVAAVISPRDLEILERHRQRESLSLADLLGEASFIAQQDSGGEGPYILEIPPREDRPNPLIEVLEELERDER